MKEKNYYVVCPSNTVTGGPDALHQLAFYMCRLGFNCKVAYMADKKKGLQIMEPYRVYINDFCLCREIKDVEDSVVIIPERFTFLTKHFKKAQVYIWWLSVDNNHITTSYKRKVYDLILSPFWVMKHRELCHCSVFSIIMASFSMCEYSFVNEQSNVSHLCASYYAFDIISKKTSRPVYKCIEPVSYVFLDKYKSTVVSSDRDNVVLFNPQKSGGFVERLKREYPSLLFKPLVNLTQSQLIDAYQKAKLYIDFGPFPGAERIPKEAVLYGCLIITGTHGASAYYGDVPIPDKYKFGNEENLAPIKEMIIYCLNHYVDCYHDFDEYRKTVLSLEPNFIDSLKFIFNEI